MTNSNYIPYDRSNDDDADRDSTNSCANYSDDEGTILAYERPSSDIDEDGDEDN